MNKPVNVYVQMALCLFPMLVFYPAYRVGKLKQGFLFIPISIAIAFVSGILMDFPDNLIADAIIIYPFMMVFVYRWSKEWNAVLADYQQKLDSQRTTPI